MQSLLGNGEGRRTTFSSRVKIALAAPSPTASTATELQNAGSRQKERIKLRHSEINSEELSHTPRGLCVSGIGRMLLHGVRFKPRHGIVHIRNLMFQNCQREVSREDVRERFSKSHR